MIKHLNKMTILTFFMALLLASSLVRAEGFGPVVEVEWLKGNIDKVVLLDVRNNPKSFKKKAKKAAVNPCGVGGGAKTVTPVGGHIDGAILVKWKDVHDKREENGAKLMMMNLEKADFEKMMSKHGVSNDSQVVITTNADSVDDILLGTRLYWMMKYYGHDNVALLNGGTQKWISDKNKVVTSKNKPEKTEYTAKDPNPALVATKADVEAAIKDGSAQLIDSRDIASYLGLTTMDEKLVPVKGHISGAKHWSVEAIIIPQGDALVFAQADEAKQAAAALGVDTAKASIAYSDLGNYASLTWFTLSELMGNKAAKVYDGSMNEWAQTNAATVVAMKME